ncbi:MAG: tetratricopeptide repeat protein [Acidobacteriota bacterium]|nr:tetratricopeptide repeat protein [Blastocatellia bacterium]MDW8240802.1 tetratricopeptide repeat protein [Acidobacteriota bacterium]
MARVNPCNWCRLLVVLLLSSWVYAQQQPDKQIEYYRAKLAKDPLHWPSHAGLGAAYLRKARDTDDVAYYAKAEEALKRSLHLQPNYEALLHLTALYVAQHRFQEAISYGWQAVEAVPSDTESYVYLSDAYFASGDYERATEVAVKMLAIKPDFYALTHSARCRYVRGDMEGALNQMQQALTVAVQDKVGQSLISWGYVQLGSHYFGVGDLNRAEQAYQQALAASPNDTLAIEHLAELRTAQRNFKAAIALYRKLLKQRANPEWQAALAGVYAQMGYTAQARRLRRQAEAAYRRAIAAGRVDYYRHLAHLYLDHDVNLAEALTLAQKDIELRRDVFAYDTLAWAYYKNGRYEQAAQTIQEALRWGIKDAELFFHAGMIYYRLGDATQARDYLERALATNPYFNASDSDMARTIIKQLARP